MVFEDVGFENDIYIYIYIYFIDPSTTEGVVTSHLKADMGEGF